MTYLIRLLRNFLHNERASAALMIPLGTFCLAVATSLSVDVGLLVNDRRDAQATVDAMALAGAQELTLSVADDAAVQVAAETRAQEWGVANGLDFADVDLTWSIEVVRNCFSADDGVSTGVLVSIERTPRMALLDYFGATWRAGATALACAGRPVESYGFLPFAVSEVGSCFSQDGAGNYTPRVGQRCEMQVGNQQMETGLNSTLGFDPDGDCPDGNPSGAELRAQIATGVPVNCAIGNSVSAGPGNTSGPARQGLQDRLGAEGDCDANSPVSNADLAAWTAAVAAAGYTPLATPTRGDGIDDLFEVWSGGPGSVLSELPAYDCDSGTPSTQSSPRNAQVIVIHDYADADGDGPKQYIVRGFIRVYIEGCLGNSGFSRTCSGGGGSFTIYARLIEQVSNVQATLGLSNYGDIGIFLKR